MPVYFIWVPTSEVKNVREECKRGSTVEERKRAEDEYVREEIWQREQEKEGMSKRNKA